MRINLKDKKTFTIIESIITTYSCIICSLLHNKLCVRLVGEDKVIPMEKNVD